MLHAEPGARVLLAAPANFSADLLASALAAAGVPPADLLRLHDPRRPINQVACDPGPRTRAWPPLPPRTPPAPCAPPARPVPARPVPARPARARRGQGGQAGVGRSQAAATAAAQQHAAAIA